MSHPLADHSPPRSLPLAVAMGIAVVVTVLGFERPVLAASLTVDSVLDYPIDTSAAPLGSCLCKSTEPIMPKTCTLRAAIQASNACPHPADTIILSSTASVYRLEIPGSGEDAAATGDFDVVPYGASGSKTVTINMNGQVLRQLISLSDDRLFDVPASEDDLTLNIQYGLLQFGEADQDSEEPGGCLRALAGTVNLYNVNFQGCAAYHAGGAIFVNDVDLWMINCNLGQNSHLEFTHPSESPTIRRAGRWRLTTPQSTSRDVSSSETAG